MTKTNIADASRIVTALFLFLLVFLMAQPALAAEMYYTTENVNLRTGAGKMFDTLDLVPKYSEVTVLEYDENAWSKVTYKEMTGYMKSEYICTSSVFEEKHKPFIDSNPKPDPTTVQLIDWSEAKNIFTIGVPAKVYDVYSGITYFVKSFSNGHHADVEPVSKEDTSLLKETYGGSWSWDPRPVWVTINGYTMAASINGMPHGSGTNPNNGMDGQVCIHFKGSTTHNGNTSFGQEHQKALIEAYNLSK